VFGSNENGDASGSTITGTVKEVCVAAGQEVEAEAVIAVID